jgi:hypothetical protein
MRARPSARGVRSGSAVGLVLTGLLGLAVPASSPAGAAAGPCETTDPGFVCRVGSTASGLTLAGGLLVGLPGSLRRGDVLVSSVAVRGAAQPDPPSGWIAAGDPAAVTSGTTTTVLRTAYKVVDGSETGALWSLRGQIRPVAGTVVAYRNALVADAVSSTAVSPQGGTVSPSLPTRWADLGRTVGFDRGRDTLVVSGAASSSTTVPAPSTAAPLTRVAGASADSGLALVTADEVASAGGPLAADSSRSVLAAGAAPTAASLLVLRPVSYSAGQSAIAGGGFISVLGSAANPAAGTRTLIAGGDTQGIFRSSVPAGSPELGKTWTPVGAGLGSWWSRHVAALLPYGSTGPDTLWLAGLGRGGTSPMGGVAASSDDGRSWTVFQHVDGLPGSPPRFDGSNVDSTDGHPRVTGKLLAAAGGRVFAASYADGLASWATGNPDAGTGWQRVTASTGPAIPARLTSLSVLPNGAGLSVFVADHPGGGSSGHLYRVDLDRPDAVTGRVTDLTATAPAALVGRLTGVLETAVVGGRLYVAGAGGAAVCTGCAAGTAAWVSLADASQARWYTVTGTRRATATGIVDTIWLGSYWRAPAFGSPGFAPALRRLQLSWGSEAATRPAPVAAQDLPDRRQDDALIYGSSTGWWFGRADGNPSGVLGGRSYLASDVADLGDGSVFVAGRAGIWHFDGTRWNPAVQGLGATFALDVATDPKYPSRVAVTDADWNFLGSRDGLATVERNVQRAGPRSMGSTGLRVAWDATGPGPLSGGLYTGGGQNTSSDGTVWSNPDPINGGSWALDPSLGTMAVRPVALTRGVVVSASGTSRSQPVEVLVNQGIGPGAGLLVREGTSSAWKALPGPGLAMGGNHSAAVAWSPDRTAVYLYVGRPDGGVSRLYRLRWNDPGWTVTRLMDLTERDKDGWLVADPLVRGRLWLATRLGGLRAVDGADSCDGGCRFATGVAVPSDPTRPVAGGPVWTNPDGTLGMASPADFWVGAGRSSGTVTPTRLWRSNLARTVWAQVAGPGFADALANPQAVAANPETGRLFVASAGNGVVVLSPR